MTLTMTAPKPKRTENYILFDEMLLDHLRVFPMKDLTLTRLRNLSYRDRFPRPVRKFRKAGILMISVEELKSWSREWWHLYCPEACEIFDRAITNAAKARPTKKRA